MCNKDFDFLCNILVGSRLEIQHPKSLKPFLLCCKAIYLCGLTLVDSDHVVMNAAS